MKRRSIFWVCLLVATLGQAFGQSSVHVMEENGTRSTRVNIVFLSEGYTEADMPYFVSHAAAVMDYLFSREPWQQYRSYCNVYRIEVPSNQSGTDYGVDGGPRDTYFNSGFTTPGVPQLLTIDGVGFGRAFNLLNTHVPEYDVPIVIVNDPTYGGGGGSISIASLNSLSAQIAEHEIGHSFAGLGDEYDAYYPGYTQQERPNITSQTTRSLIKWRDWIEQSTPVPTPETYDYDALVGLFEGAMYTTTGWYRPHNNSLMRNLGRPVGEVNRQQFVLSYYLRVSPIDSLSPPKLSDSVTTFERLVFSVQPKVPSGGPPLQVTWMVDWHVRPDQTGTQFSINSDELGNGDHVVIAEVRDPTSFVRTDPNAFLQETIIWDRSLSNQLPPNLAAWRSAYGPDEAVPANDGLANLLKYALGIDPNQPASASQRPAITITSSGGANYLTLVVPRRTRRTDVTTTVQIAGAVAAPTWNSGPGHTVVLEDRDDLLVVRDALPMSASTRRYMRVNVSAP